MKFIYSLLILFFASFVGFSQTNDTTITDEAIIELYQSYFNDFMEAHPLEKGKKKDNNKGKPEEEVTTETPSIGTMSVEPTWDEPEVVEPGFVNPPIGDINACIGGNISLDPGILDFTNPDNFVLLSYNGFVGDMEYIDQEMGWRFTGQTSFFLKKSIPIDPYGYYRIEVDVFNEGDHDSWLGGWELANNRTTLIGGFKYFLPEFPLAHNGDFETYSQEKHGYMSSDPYDAAAWYPGTEYFEFGAILNQYDFNYESSTYIREIRIYGQDKYTGQYVNYVLNGTEINWTKGGSFVGDMDVLTMNNVSIAQNGLYECYIRDTKTGMDNFSEHIGLTVEQTLSAGIDQSICLGENVQLSASGGSIYTWSPTTGLSNPNIANPIASPTVTTTYTVTSTGLCAGTDQVKVTVNSPPNISVNSNVTIYEKNSTMLYASGATNYSWTSSSGGFTSTSNSPLVSPMQTTTYTVTGTSNGCSGSSKQTTVNVTPLPNYPPPLPELTVIEGCEGIDVDIWLYMPVIELEEEYVDYYFDITGNVNYYGPEEGIEAIGRCELTLREEWAIPIEPDKQYLIQVDVECDDYYAENLFGGYHYDGGMNPLGSYVPHIIDTYQQRPYWSFDRFRTLEVYIEGYGVGPNYWAEDTENFIFSMILNDRGDGTTFVRDIRIIELDTGTDYIQNSVGYQWQKNGVNMVGEYSSDLNLTNLSPSDAGNYSCAIFDEYYGIQTGLIGTSITVNPLPVTISPDSDICSGESVQLSASGGVNYSWSPATGLSNTTGSNTTATPNSSQTYNVLVTAANGCSASEQVNVNVKPTAALTINSPKTFACDAEVMSFTSTISPSYSSINWYINDTYNMTTKNVDYVMPNVGNNTVKLAVELNGCTSEVTKVIERKTLPTVPTVNDVSKEYPAQVTLTAATADLVQWYAQGVSTPIATGGSFTSDVHDDIVYELTVNDGYCESDKGQVSIEIVNPTPSTLYSIGSGMWNVIGTWAASDGGEPTVVLPNNNTTVIIKGNTVEMNENSQSGNLFILDGGGQTSKLKITSGTLTVNGEVRLSGENSQGAIDLDVSPTGKLICIDPNN